MKTNEIIGIDVSNLTIDVWIYSTQVVSEFKNIVAGFKEMKKWILKNTSFNKQETMFVFEHTGMYSHKLSVFLSDQKSPFFVTSGLKIKRSMGIVRGKLINVYCTFINLCRTHDKLRCTTICFNACFLEPLQYLLMQNL